MNLRVRLNRALSEERLVAAASGGARDRSASVTVRYALADKEKADLLAYLDMAKKVLCVEFT